MALEMDITTEGGLNVPDAYGYIHRIDYDDQRGFAACWIEWWKSNWHRTHNYPPLKVSEDISGQFTIDDLEDTFDLDSVNGVVRVDGTDWCPVTAFQKQLIKLDAFADAVEM